MNQTAMCEAGWVRPIEERDPELEGILREIERRLEAGATLRGSCRDAHLTLVEALAAPYAIAFMLEIRRMDELFRNAP